MVVLVGVCQEYTLGFQSSGIIKPKTSVWHTVVKVSTSDSQLSDVELSNKPKYGQKRIIKPSLAVPYHSLVESAYVRHILVETAEMADLIYDMLYGKNESSNNNSSNKNSNINNSKVLSSTIDPFGQLASQMSTCKESAQDMGAIGWLDNPFFEQINRQPVIDHALLSQTSITELFERQPKGGDVLTLTSPRGVHLIRIEDVLVSKPQTGEIRQRKLSGKGLYSRTPLIGKVRDENDTDDRPVASTFTVLTNGCQMNVADSERMQGILSNNLQLESTDNSKKANVVVINTCSIRDHAESKLYDQLGPLAARKRNGEHLAVVVSGCVAQQEGQKLLRKFPEVDAVMGPQYVNRLEDILEDVSRGHQVVATDPTLIMEDMSRPVRSSKVKAWVNVIYGCNEHCTYCVVPHTRGVEQSRTIESIVDEVLELANQGYKEVTLLGQNIDAYGRDMVPKRTFADLLETLNSAIANTGMERIRYVTSHPRYFSDRVIDAVANLDKVCECFHVPFQSGDNGILQHMRRGYTHESYMKIIDKIKAAAPHASIHGDVIVGFPGETQEAFERTLELMSKVKFDQLNTYAYSPRPNTEAADWTNQVPEDVKSERLQQIMRLSVQHTMERTTELYADKLVEVLVEDQRNPKNPNQVMGRTRQGRLIFFEGSLEDLQGKLVMVKVTEVRPFSLTGNLETIIR